MPSSRRSYFKKRSQAQTFIENEADSTTRFGNKKKVSCLGWNYTGTYLASGSEEGICRVYSISSNFSRESGTVVKLEGHSKEINALAWSPASDKILGTGAFDKTVRFWDVRAQKQAWKFDKKVGIVNLAWSPDGKFVAIGDSNDLLEILDVRTQKIIRDKSFSAERINAMTFAPPISGRNPHIIISTRNETFNFLTLRSLKCACKVNAHAGHVFCLDYNMQSRCLATGGADAVVSVWDMEDLAILHSFQRFDSPVRCLSFSHDGNILASADKNSFIDLTWIGHYGDHDLGCQLTKLTASSINDVKWNPRHPVLAYAAEK